MTIEIKARWVLELNCQCPECSNNIDLLEDGDFWGNTRVECGEHETENSRGVEAYCTECEHEFEVDLEY